VSFEELKSIKISPGFEVDCDLYWEVRRASEIEKIEMGNHWSEIEESENGSSRKEKTDDARNDLAIRRDH